MTEPTDPEDQDVDGSDEDDHDAMETAIGAALAALLVAELLPGPSSFFPSGRRGSGSWADRVEAVLGETVRGFVTRSAFDLAAASGLSGASNAAAEAAETVYPQVMQHLEERSFETLEHLTDRHLQDDQVASAAQSAAENLARGVSAYAKGEARERTAGKLGAVWKIWRSRRDNRVRDTHRDLNGTKVAMHGRWSTDEGYIRYPGDPEAAINLTAGCRCHLNYRMRPVDNEGSQLMDPEGRSRETL